MIKKIILITGSSGLLGKKLTLNFLNKGHIVIGFDMKNNIKNKNFYFKKVDLIKEKQIVNALNTYYKKFKKIDVVINNAAYSPYSDFLSRNYKEFKKTVDINLYAPFSIIQNYYRNFKRYKNSSGKIINVASIYGVISPNMEIYENKKKVNSEIYGATKAGLIQLTKYFSNIFAKDNISVNSVSPGGIENKKIQSADFIKKYSKNVPQKRMADTEEVVELISYLANKKENYTTGHNFIIDGGLSIKWSFGRTLL